LLVNIFIDIGARLTGIADGSAVLGDYIMMQNFQMGVLLKFRQLQQNG